MNHICTSCGAQISFEAKAQSLVCPFCNAVNSIERPELKVSSAFELVVPFTVTRSDLENVLYAYIASGDFTPDDMLEASEITHVDRIYVPAYSFKVTYEATWTASFGYDRKEPYTAYRNVTRNNRTVQEAYTAYKTVTDWHPANGVDSGFFYLASYAGSKLLNSPLAPASLVTQSVLSGNATIYDQRFTAGFDVENFAVPESVTYETLKDAANENIDKRVRSHAQGDNQRDWHWTANIIREGTAYAVPICHLTFRYNDRDYSIWVRGDDPTAFVADKLPVDERRRKTVLLGYWPAVFTFGLAAVTSYVWSFSWTGLLAASMPLYYGVARQRAIVGQSKTLRNALLLQKQASSQNLADLSDEDRERLAQSFTPPKPTFWQRIRVPNDKIGLPLIAALSAFFIISFNVIKSPEYASWREQQQTKVQETPQATQNLTSDGRLLDTVAIVNGKKIPVALVEQVTPLFNREGRPVTPEMRKQIKNNLIAREIYTQEALRRGLQDQPDVKIELDLVREQTLINAVFADVLARHPAMREAQSAGSRPSDSTKEQIIAEFQEELRNKSSVQLTDNHIVVNGGQVALTKVDDFAKVAPKLGWSDHQGSREELLTQVVTRELLLQEARARALLTDPQVRAEMDLRRQQVLIEALFANFLASTVVTESEVQAAYAGKVITHREQEVRVRHILVQDEQFARDIILQLRNGARFEDLAKQASLDTGSAANGGDLGWIVPSSYVPQFATVLAKLSKGEIAEEPVRTQFGWHIIRVEDKRQGPSPELDEVRLQVEDKLRQEKLKKFKDELIEKASIEFHDF